MSPGEVVYMADLKKRKTLAQLQALPEKKDGRAMMVNYDNGGPYKTSLRG